MKVITDGRVDESRESLTLVGFTTEQVTSNLVPIIQFQARCYVAVDSVRAQERMWGEGLCEVLRARGLLQHRIHLERKDEASLEGIRCAIERGLRELRLWDRPIGWIFGGGLKIQQLASFLLFLDRSATGMMDSGLYADAEGRALICIRRDRDGRLTEERDTTRVDLSIAEIITAFNHKTSIRSVKIDDNSVEREYSRFLHDSSYRQDWIQRFERSAMDEMVTVDQLLTALNTRGLQEIRERADKDIEEWLPTVSYPPQKRDLAFKPFRSQIANVVVRTCFDRNTWKQILYPEKQLPPVKTEIGTYKTFAQYFEKLVISRVLARFPETKRGQSVAANVEIFSRDGRPEGEHDILLAQRNGTLISLDAKTFAIEKKDFDARLLNLRNTSGRFARYILVFPWFDEDLDVMPQRLKEMPVECQRLGWQFLVVSSRREPFWVRFKPNTRIIEVCEKGADGAVMCRNLDAFLDELDKTG